MDPKFKKEVDGRLSRIAGQVRGISKMVDEDQYCVDVLTQVASLRAALHNLGSMLASAHIEECVYGEDSLVDNSEERLEEVRKTLTRFLK